MLSDTELLQAIEHDPFHRGLAEAELDRAWPVTEEEREVLAVVIALEDAWAEEFGEAADNA